MLNRQIKVQEVVTFGFFSSIGIYYNHDVTPEMKNRANEILKFLEIPHLENRLMCDFLPEKPEGYLSEEPLCMIQKPLF